jgi:regulator of sirC expression with transglutaminase-like and TPR domain
MNAEDRDYLKLIEARNDPDADKRWLIAHLEAETAEKEELKRQLTAHLKTLPQVLKAAETDRAALRAEVERLREVLDLIASHSCGVCTSEDEALAALAASAPAPSRGRKA